MAKTGRPRSNPILMEQSGAYRNNPSRKPDATTLIKVSAVKPDPTILVQSDELTLQIWDETCESLDSMSILTASDKFLIEAYCINLRELYVLADMVRKEGHFQVKPDGTRVACPNVISYHKLMGTHIKLMNELGLTCQARLRMAAPTVDTGNKTDDVADLMKRLGGGK